MARITRLVSPRLDDLDDVADLGRPIAPPAARKVPASPGPAYIATPDRSEARRYYNAFGPQGVVWYVEGKTFGGAQALSIAELRKERDEAVERLKQAGG